MDDCSGKMPVDSILSYHCNTGYSIFSTNTFRICQSNGEWSKTSPKCEKGMHACNMLDVHKINDNHMIILLLSCLFSVPLHFKTDNCPCPSSPVNGNITSCVGSTLVGSYIYYYCDRGYELVGDFSRMCQIGATWTGSAPTCEMSEYE